MKLTDDERLNRTLSALADPTRRDLLRRLMAGETRVTELAEPFDISLAAVSKHISVLERAGLVKRRRVWREHMVSYIPEPLDAVAEWIKTQREYWSQRLKALDAMLQAEDAAKVKTKAQSADTAAPAKKKVRKAKGKHG